jgi:hypothetical protein
MLCDRILTFYKSLSLEEKLPAGIAAMNPYQNPTTFGYTEKFYKKFYADDNSRTLILGINPGRLGGGLTGIPFTDPKKLEQFCGIKNDLHKKPELSADFIYTMIEAFGGPGKFYKHYFISAVCPLGFIKDGKNLNYYDQKELHQAVSGFITKTLQAQLDFGLNKEVCYCLGEGKNYQFLLALNKEVKFFTQIVPLPHPRFIMQYRRKRLQEFVALYLEKLSNP